ncbi:MAG: TonB-dependent receptor, partial [Phycisphaerae bacterium]|nr:TonB-dependent receptor [Saprospiraceae bacterium]
YKANGRNYLYANGFIGTKAPQFRDIFLSPRNQNSVVPGVDPYTLQSVEAGFIHRAPKLRARLTGYLTNFKDEVETYQQYIPRENEFATLVRTGVDRQHMGVEAAFEFKPVPSWVLSGATNLGYYHYTSQPLLYVTYDNTGETQEPETVYQKNFLVPRTPQTAASLGLKHEGKRFWFASLSFNWTDNFWSSFDPTRRTAEGVLAAQYPLGQGPGTPLWGTIIDQIKAPSAYTLDFFGGKSWKINDVFIYLNVGVNNILDNKNIRVSGRESNLTTFSRDPDNELLYSDENQYAPGLNYFISLGVRI